MIVHAVLFAGIAIMAVSNDTIKPAQNTPVAVASSQKAAEKPVCRRYADVGSNIARRKICMTKSQWDKMARDSQELGRSMQPALTTGAQ
jgi:hypothetical protein